MRGAFFIHFIHFSNQSKLITEKEMAATNAAAEGTTTTTMAETVCPVCLESFQSDDGAPRTPLMLGCGHAVCRVCVAAIVARSSEGKAAAAEAVECPACRKPTALARPGDVSALPKNFALIALLADRSSSSAAATTTTLCDGCGEAPATVFCAECRGVLCASCDEYSHKYALTRNHKRVPVGERAAVEEPRCPLHRKKLQLYCKTCKALCCMFCEKSAHKGHDVVLLDEAAADIGSGLRGDVDRLQASLQVAGREAQFAETAEAARKAIDELRASNGTVAERMEREFAELRGAVDAKERELRAQQQEAFKPALATFEAQLADASTALPGARAALKAGEQAAASASAAQETQQSVVQINEALGAWRGVRAAIAANERCAGLSVEARKVVWDGSTKEARDAVARVCAVRSSLDPPPLPPFPGVSFRDGPNYAVSGPHRNVLSCVTGGWIATAVGERALPRNCKTRWAVKIVRSQNGHIMIGVAPPTIDQGTANNYSVCGCYFYTVNSTLNSGPPQSFSGNKQYGQLSGRVAEGSIVEVEADTEHGTLSFTVDGKCGGIAYEGLPADIVPVVIFSQQGDSVEVVWP